MYKTVMTWFLVTCQENLLHLRGSDYKPFVPRPLTESLKKSFTYRGATQWNDIYPSKSLELNLLLSLNLKFLNYFIIFVSCSFVNILILIY
jgi:hypothetical protein